MNSLVRAALLVLAGILPFGGQADDKTKEKEKEKQTPRSFPGPLCSKCKTTGKIENPFWKELGKGEEKVRYCSFLSGKDPTGCGLPWLPCKDCRNEAAQAAAQAEFAPLVAIRTQWLTERRTVDKTLDADLVHVETKNFRLSFSIEKLSVDNRQLTQHEAAHLYLERLEKLYQDFLTRFGLREQDMNFVQHWVLLLANQKQSTKAGPIYVGLSATEGCKRMGRNSVFVTRWNKQNNPQEADLHRYVVHHVSHQLLTVMGAGPLTWLSEAGSGWLEEGLGHFYEMEWFNEANTHCMREANMLTDWISDEWHGWIRKRLATGDVLSLASLDGKPTDVFSAKEHVFCWSYVDYLLNGEDPKKFAQFVTRLKTKGETLQNAMRAVYGFTVTAFNDNWKDYVTKKYR